MAANLKFVGATIDESGMGVMTFKVSGALPALSIGETYALAAKVNGQTKPKRVRRAAVKPITKPKLDKVIQAAKGILAKRKSGGRPTSEQRITRFLAANTDKTRADAIVALKIKNVAA